MDRSVGALRNSIGSPKLAIASSDSPVQQPTYRSGPSVSQHGSRQPRDGDQSVRTKEHSKVTASHLKRDAYLYVRQSTYRQVFENAESTNRQYALRDRATALGWPVEKITVIDCDQGQSGASAADRKGFQQLVADVGLGRVGIVLGLEVSRLARNSSDWHRLLEICAMRRRLGPSFRVTSCSRAVAHRECGCRFSTEVHLDGVPLCQRSVRHAAREI